MHARSTTPIGRAVAAGRPSFSEASMTGAASTIFMRLSKSRNVTASELVTMPAHRRLAEDGVAGAAAPLDAADETAGARMASIWVSFRGVHGDDNRPPR